MITLRAANIFTEITGDLDSKTKRDIERELSFRPEGFQFSPAFNSWIYDKDGKRLRRRWDGWRRQFWSNKTRTYFPTGLYSVVAGFLKANSIPYLNEDCRDKPSPNYPLESTGAFLYRDYQETVIDDACNAHRGIIQCATGSGKTVIGAGIIERLGVSPFLFFVTSIDLLTQAKDSLEKALSHSGKPVKIGQLGGGVIDIQDINVCTIQTVVRALGKRWDKSTKFDSEDTDDKTPIEEHREEIKELVRETQGSICDEVQHWRAETCQLVARSLKSAYYTYGMSATPYRDAGDDMLIQSCFGKKCAEITATELIERGWLVRPNIKIVHVRGPRTKYKQWQSIYKDRVTENKKYNELISNIANSYVDKGRLVLSLVQQIAHGKYLASMIHGSKFLSGSSSKKKREDGLNQLRNRYISSIVSSAIFDEGIDVKPLDTVLLCGQGKSRTRAMQRVGRICRPYTAPDGTKKTTATAVDFCIHDKYLKDHAIEREKMYRIEPAYNIEHIDPEID